MDNTMKIVEFVEKSNLSINRVSERIQNESK